MGAPRLGPCADWIDAEDVFDCGSCAAIAVADQDAALAARMVALASEVLYALSGRQFSGACEGVVRPCRRTAWFSSHPSLTVAPWGVCACQAEPHRSCGCGTLDEVTLGGYPIVSVDNVRVDGADLPASAYRVDDFQYLVRVDGEGWPCCQDLAADPATDDNTWEVEFTYGVAPPQSGVDAARALACELYQSCTGGKCRLPARVSSITRQGVTAAVFDPFDFLEKGLVGLYEVDLFLRAYNPHGRRQRATVASPDVGRRVRRAGT